MAEEEERGFVIRDKRGQSTESETRDKSPQAGPRAEDAKQSEQAHHHLPPSFLAFVYSLGSSALMMLGETPEQGSGPPQNLAHAQEIIDILTILETKTKGNLTEEEGTLLQEMLYTLRIKYVEKASSPKS